MCMRNNKAASMAGAEKVRGRVTDERTCSWRDLMKTVIPLSNTGGFGAKM